MTSSICEALTSGTYLSMSEESCSDCSQESRFPESGIRLSNANVVCMRSCRKAAVVRMGLMAATHADVQALHIDALCQKHLGSDKDLHERKGAMRL